MMEPECNVEVVISCDGDDAQHLRMLNMLLRRNLKTAGLRTSPRPEGSIKRNDEVEEKSAPVSLYTLGLTFLTSGAAVALVNAVRATFAAAHSTKLRVQIQLPTKTIEISGDNLTDSRSDQLLAVLTKELPS